VQQFFPQHHRNALAGAGIHFAEQLLHELFKTFAAGGK
jgi:hypothetical protein